MREIDRDQMNDVYSRALWATGSWFVCGTAFGAALASSSRSTAVLGMVVAIASSLYGRWVIMDVEVSLNALVSRLTKD